MRGKGDKVVLKVCWLVFCGYLVERDNEGCYDRAVVFAMGTGRTVEVRAIHTENEIGRKSNKSGAFKYAFECG